MSNADREVTENSPTAKLLNEMVAVSYHHSDRMGGETEGEYLDLCIDDMKRFYMTEV